ncbi:MAG: response regulator [Gammaproteobacteria bacterium]|nr:response regulator [Gammaproteobacteria bacterium]
MERADTLGNQVVVTPDGGSDDGGTSSSKGGVSNAATGGAGAEVEEREPEGIPESPPEDGSIGGPRDGDQDEPQDEDGEFEDPSVVSSGSDQGVHTRLEPANETSVIEIFRYEVATHQVTIQAYLSSAAGEAPDPAPITRELVLACQTLHGSAKVAGIAELAELFGLLEEVLDNRFERNIPITEDELPALWEGADLLTVAMEKLESDPGRMVDAGSSLFDPAASARREDLLQQLRVLNDSISPSSMADQSEPDKEQTAVSGERPTVRKEQMGIAAGDGDDLVHELREVFIEEAEEILEANDAVFQEWRKSPADLEPIKKLQRQLHTLKGGARMAELPAIGDLGHGLESALTLVVDGLLPVTNQLRELVQSADDRLAEMLDIVRKNEAPEAADDILARIDGLISPGTDTLPLSEYADQKVDRLVGEQGLMGGESVTEPGVMSKASHENVSADKEHRVQIRAQALDSFVNYAGEISISRSRVEQQMGEFKYSLDEMDQTVNRLRDQLRGLEIEAESQIIYRHETVTTPREEDFDPLELDRFSQMQQLSRGLLESVSDLESIQNLLEDLTRESETILLQQARINTDLQQGLMKMRLLPVARHVPRLRRIIRQTAKALNKRVELHVQGQNEELDHTILGRIVAPLEHVLRNAVDHGIEAPEERRNAGKPEIGTIELLVSRDGSEAVIRIRDDGRGLNMDAIHQQAAERGLLPEGTNLTDEELVQLVFEQAFSTASEVTQISGRGVGLGVVSTEVKQLGGSLQVESNPGAGTTFTIRLPTTLSVTQALMVMAGDEVFAAPLGSVEGIVRLNHGQIVALLADESPIYQHLGNPYSVAYLGDLLGLGVEPLSRENIRYPVLLARAGEHRMAFVVDRLSGRREVVIKPIGSQLSAIRWIAGATILGDGRVVIILDIPALIRKGVMSPVLRRQEEKPFERAIEQQTPMIMVVDDSITVRKVTERFLLRHGMDVQLARDGVEALALLQNHKPDIMLLDIEMPRMDGYELATTVRHDESLKDLPIIMITSRAGKKHTERARRIGVNRYLGKPYQEGELLSSIQDLLISTHA